MSYCLVERDEGEEEDGPQARYRIVLHRKILGGYKINNGATGQTWLGMYKS